MSNPEEDAATPVATVSAITLKLPPFWPKDTETWFAQIEAQFSTRGITAEKTRFDYLVASLSSDAATEVRDLILTPPTDTPYTTLKQTLIKRFAGSNQQKLQRLLNELELGDSKPSQLLRRMRQLWCGEGANDAILQELFLQRLPSNVRMVLAPTGSTVPLDTLAEMADRIVEVANPPVAALQTPSAPSPPSNPEVDSLRSEVRQLKELVHSLSLHSRPRDSRHRSPTPACRRSPVSPRRSAVHDDPTLCWYHQRFGSAATKCREPCRLRLNDQASR